MKINSALFFFLICQFAHAMGSPYLFPANNPLSASEYQHVNDMQETAAGVNQVSKDRGHVDQQNMEEKEIEQEKEKEKEQEVEQEKPIPLERPQINHE